MDKKKLPPATESSPQHVNPAHSTELTKAESMLAHFAQGNRLHRFDAERLGDHCLPSTVSGLQYRHAITFSREWVEVPNRFKTPARVMLYFLEGDSLAKARAIVSGRAGHG